MEISLSKVTTLLVAVAIGYMVYQKTSQNPLPSNSIDAQAPKAAEKKEETPPSSTVSPSPAAMPQPAGSQGLEQPPALPSSVRQPEPQTKTVDVSDINAVPLSNPTTLRRAYYDFLSKRNPRAFLICRNGSVQVLTGNLTFIHRQIAELAGQCSPYAIDDAVVWTGS